MKCEFIILKTNLRIKENIMIVKVVGCSTSWTDRPSSSYCIDNTILVDCGEGTTKYYKKNKIVLTDIRHIFITHFHGDHFLGLGQFIAQELNYATEESKKRMTIYGPKGLLKYLNILKNYYAMTGSLAKQFDIQDYINVVEITDLNTKIKVNDYQVSAYKINHIEGSPCLAYVFEDSKTKLGFSGDTTFDKYLIKFIENVDSAFLECCSFTTSKYHLGLDKYLEISKKYYDKNFYAIHCIDKVYKNAKKYNIEVAKDGKVYEF